MTGSSFRLRVYPSRLLMDSMLFLSEINLYRASEEVEVTSKLVLQETSVRLADILRKITEECE